ncbi:MAG: hypothetical protein WDN45_06225 [Caulobacteraceae bacterium]
MNPTLNSEMHEVLDFLEQERPLRRAGPDGRRRELSRRAWT